MIERASKSFARITHPSDWRSVIRKAATKAPPFRIVEMKYSDFGSLSSSPNYFENLANSHLLKITQFVWYRYSIVEGKHRLQARKSFKLPGDNLALPEIPKNVRDEGPKIEFDQTLTADTRHFLMQDPIQFYNTRIPITAETKLDLLQYIADGVIPRRHLQYYQTLPMDSTSKANLKKVDGKVKLINEKYNSNQYNEVDDDLMETMTTIDNRGIFY